MNTLAWAWDIVIGTNAWAIVFFGTLWIHELGHKFAFWIFGQRTKTKIQWYGASEGTLKEMLPLQIRQLIIVHLMGPIFGLLPAYLSGQPWFMQVYLWGCILDFVHAFELLNVERKYMKMPYRKYIGKALRGEL